MGACPLWQRLCPNWSMRIRELLSGPLGDSPGDAIRGGVPGGHCQVRKARKEERAVRRKSLDVAERMRKESGGW